MKLIQLGMGGMGDAWIKAVLASKVARYAAFVEINPTIVEEQRQKHKRLQKVPVFKSLDEALAAVQADGVVAVIPPQFRIETAQKVFTAGLPLLAEKPLASSLADAQVLLKLAQESGLLYMVGQDYRYKPTMQTIKQTLEAGTIGAVESIDVGFYRGLRLLTYHSLMHDALLQDMSIHHFDLLRFFLGAEPQTIYGRSWNPPWSEFKGNASAAALMTFPGDVTVTYHASWVATGHINDWDGVWRIQGEKGTLILDNNRVYVQRTTGIDDRLFTYDPVQLIPLVKMKHSRQASLIQQFHAAVTEGQRPPTTIEDNFKSFQMIFDLIESSRTGQIIQR
jgi:predicted dehydrogenase